MYRHLDTNKKIQTHKSWTSIICVVLSENKIGMLIMIKLCQNIQMDFNKSNDIKFTVTLVLPKMKYL